MRASALFGIWLRLSPRVSIGLGGVIAIACTSSTTATATHMQKPVAIRAARVINLSEQASLKLSGENGSAIQERGSGWGTFKAPIVASLTINPSNVTGTFTISPKGGSITGRALARFVVRGATGYYGGTLTIIRGTGIYRHASGSNIGISGTISRQTFALSVKAHGRLSY